MHRKRTILSKKIHTTLNTITHINNSLHIILYKQIVIKISLILIILLRIIVPAHSITCYIKLPTYNTILDMILSRSILIYKNSFYCNKLRMLKYRMILSLGIYIYKHLYNFNKCWTLKIHIVLSLCIHIYIHLLFFNKINILIKGKYLVITNVIISAQRYGYNIITFQWLMKRRN